MNIPKIDAITNTGKFALEHSKEFKTGMYIVFATGISISVWSAILIYTPNFK